MLHVPTLIGPQGKESVQEYSASEGHKMPGRLQYWDLLMQNPAGKELPKRMALAVCSVVWGAPCPADACSLDC